MNTIKIFGENVQAARKETGLSQEKLAEISGLHRTYISTLERGLRNPTLSTIIALCKALKIKPDVLFKGVSD